MHLRGFALLAIVLLHNLEHYNIYFIPNSQPEWLQIIDKGVWDTLFFLFAGKAYATFSLLFGFSFYIQYHNAEKGIDFRGRFALAMVLLFLFAQLHALFYNGDILVLFNCRFYLIPVCKLKTNRILAALILLLQPLNGDECSTRCNPDYVINGNKFLPYAPLATEVTSHGTFLEVLNNNIWNGQLYSNIWQVETDAYSKLPHCSCSVCYWDVRSISSRAMPPSEYGNAY